MEQTPIPIQTLQRLPIYLKFLRALPENGVSNISATTIAEALGLNDVQVRKDLASVSGGGRPKIGYITKDLISDIEEFLGYGDMHSAVIVGAGNLGRALLHYKSFADYGLKIVAAFDHDPSIIGASVNGRQVLPAEKLREICSRMKIRIGIVTVPDSEAQKVCDMLISGGVLAILNFTSVRLKVPSYVMVRNENMACSLAVLSKHLTERLIICE